MRYVETITVPIDEPKDFPGNARIHDEDWLDRTTSQGQHQSILVRRLSDGTLQILGGHGTRGALRRRGDATIRAEVMECNDEEALTISLSLNPPPGIGSFDNSALVELLKQARDAAVIEATGWTDENLDDLMSAIERNDDMLSAVPDQFPSVGEDVATEYRCPDCGYEWSGKQA